MPQGSRPQFEAREPSAVPPRPMNPRPHAPLERAPEPESNRTLMLVGLVVVLAGAFGMWRHFTRPAAVASAAAGDPGFNRELQTELREARAAYGEDFPPEVVLRARAREAAQAAADTPALAAYEQAKAAIAGGQMRAAVESLQQAIAHDEQFAEAWYQLGAAQTRLAIEAVRSDEELAVSLYRQAVASKQRARTLIEAGSLRVWTPQQVDQVRSDLGHALEDAEAVLADRPSLIAALHLWAQSS